MEALNNILNTIISKGEITYRQINYLIRESETLKIDVSKELCDYDIKLNEEDAEKELKWLRTRKNIELCGRREKNTISKATKRDIIFKGLHKYGNHMYEAYYYLGEIAYLHGNRISIVG